MRAADARFAWNQSETTASERQGADVFLWRYLETLGWPAVFSVIAAPAGLLQVLVARRFLAIQCAAECGHLDLGFRGCVDQAVGEREPSTVNGRGVGGRRRPRCPVSTLMYNSAACGSSGLLSNQIAGARADLAPPRTLEFPGRMAEMDGSRTHPGPYRP
jgi:hypothetical protein